MSCPIDTSTCEDAERHVIFETAPTPVYLHLFSHIYKLLYALFVMHL